MPETTPQQESPYELQRLLQNLLKWGTVAAVRAKPLAVRMQCGDNTTDWLTPAGLAAGAVFSAYRMPEVGEQGLALCAGGDLGQGVALLGIYSDAMPQPSDGPPHIKLNKPGTHFVRYEAGKLLLTIGPARITLEQDSITLQVGGAHFTMEEGGITTNINIETLADVIASGISLNSHPHGGVTPGMGLTGEPV